MFDDLSYTPRIIAFITAHPGRTAWGIGKELRLHGASVSSTLCKLAKKHRVRRRKGMSGSWTYWPKLRRGIQRVLEGTER